MPSSAPSSCPWRSKPPELVPHTTAAPVSAALMTPAGASSTKQDAPAVCLADLAGSDVGWEGIDSGIAIRNINMDTCNISMDTCNSERSSQELLNARLKITNSRLEISNSTLEIHFIILILYSFLSSKVSGRASEMSSDKFAEERKVGKSLIIGYFLNSHIRMRQQSADILYGVFHYPVVGSLPAVLFAYI